MKMQLLFWLFVTLFAGVRSQDFTNVQYPVGFKYVCLNGTTVSVPSAEVEQYKAETGAFRGPCRLPADDVTPPQDPETGYGVFSIGHGAYWIAAGSYQMMFVVYDSGVVLVDCPASSTKDSIMSAIASRTDKPLTHIIYSHSHADHVAGCSQFPQNLTYIGSKATKRNFETARANSKLPYGVYVGGNGVVPKNPDIVVGESYTLTLGNQTLELRNEAFFHSDSDILVYAVGPKALMLVDVAYPGIGPFTDLGFSGNAKGYLQAHDLILDYDFNIFLAGHLNSGDRSQLEEMREFIFDLFANAEEALQTVSIGSFAAEIGIYASPWNVAGEYFDELVDVCSRKTLAKWASKLKMLDVFMPSHCLGAITAIRID